MVKNHDAICFSFWWTNFCDFWVLPSKILPLGGTLKKVGWNRALLTPAIILTFLVVVAYGTDPGIAPYYLVPWALLTWGWVLGLPCGGHRMLLGGKSGSGRDTVIRKLPCQWISCFRSPLVCSVKRVLGQRGRCPWGSTTVHVCCSAQFSAWYRAPPQICPANFCPPKSPDACVPSGLRISRRVMVSAALSGVTRKLGNLM